MPVVSDKTDRTSVWYLFNRRFMCRTHPQAMRTIEDIKMFGTPSTGDAVIDREMAKEWPLRMLNIAEMEDVFHRGYNIRLVKYDDAKKVYELISDHLLVWRTFFTMAENNRVDEETVEELIRLDKFAAAVYEPAKSLFTKEIAVSIFGRHAEARRRGGFMSRSLFNKPEAAAVPVPDGEKPNKYPERVSHAPLFARQKNIGGTEWK